MNDIELSDFFGDLGNNTIIRAEINEYIIIVDANGETCKTPYYWDGVRFNAVSYNTFESKEFGVIKPKGGDPYQVAYFDSLVRNQLTFCTGPAGAGKSQIALAHAFSEKQKGNIDRIIVFANPYIAKSAVKLGFLPGTKEDKLMETSVGGILISKLGGRVEVERLLNSEELILMPIGDCRGYEIPPNSFVYFTEAQNLSVYLMKLFLQRITDDSKICVEGDIRQTDSEEFDEGNNGLLRAIEVFEGENYASHVNLQHIYRGKIAKKAEEM